MWDSLTPEEQQEFWNGMSQSEQIAFAQAMNRQEPQPHQSKWSSIKREFIRLVIAANLVNRWMSIVEFVRRIIRSPNPVAKPLNRWKAIAIGAVITCGVLVSFFLGSIHGQDSSPPSVGVVQNTTGQDSSRPQVVSGQQGTGRDPGTKALGDLFEALSDWGRDPVAFQANHDSRMRAENKQQCLACNGMGYIICPYCRNSGSLCRYHQGGICPACRGQGWR